MVDKDKFLFLYEQQQFGALTKEAQAGLLTLLGFIEADSQIQDSRWAAYMLATAKWETGQTFQPIAEYGKGKGHKYGIPATNGQVYYGRGYVQLTWDYNYKAMSKPCGVDLYANPDFAMKPEIAYRIMSYGMRNGSFTGVGLKKYIDGDKCDFLNARRIINGTDQAAQIADYATKMLYCLETSALTIEDH
jgi:putative chitinase